MLPFPEPSEMAAAIRAGAAPAALQAFAEELATFSEEELEQLLSRDWVDVPFHEHLGDPLVETFVRFSMTYLDAHPEARELFAASAGEAERDLRHPECLDGTLEIRFAVSALVRAIAGTAVGGAALYAACVSIGPASLGLCASALGFYIGWQMDTVGPQALCLEGKLDALLDTCEQECGGDEQACGVVPLGDGCSCEVEPGRPGSPCEDGCALCLGPDEQFCDANGDGDGFVCPVTWARYVEASAFREEVCRSSPGSGDCVTF